MGRPSEQRYTLYLDLTLHMAVLIKDLPSIPQHAVEGWGMLFGTFSRVFAKTDYLLLHLSTFQVQGFLHPLLAQDKMTAQMLHDLDVQRFCIGETLLHAS